MSEQRDYATTPLARKLGIGEGARVHLLGGPDSFARDLAPLPPGVEFVTRLRAPVDVVILFVTRVEELRRRFARLADALSPAGGLWIAWPKKTSATATDLSFDVVQRTGLDAGLVDNKSCAIDEDWQAVRFVRRRADRRGA